VELRVLPKLLVLLALLWLLVGDVRETSNFKLLPRAARGVDIFTFEAFGSTTAVLKTTSGVVVVVACSEGGGEDLFVLAAASVGFSALCGGCSAVVMLISCY